MRPTVDEDSSSKSTTAAGFCSRQFFPFLTRERSLQIMLAIPLLGRKYHSGLAVLMQIGLTAILVLLACVSVTRLLGARGLRKALSGLTVTSNRGHRTSKWIQDMNIPFPVQRLGFPSRKTN
jgi:hypothetical protein